MTESQIGRWYMVNRDGMATLCTDRADAEKEAADAQSVWPHMGPHRAVQLVEASFEAADMATAAARGFRDGVASIAASAGELSSLISAGVPTGYWDGEFSDVGCALLYEVPQVSAFGRQYRNIPLYTHPATPEGMVMVPKEPTEAMRAAAVKYVNGSAVYKNVKAEVLRIEEGIYGEVYEAMIAAAPLPPTSAEGVEHG